MKPIAIGTNNHLESRFERVNKLVTRYLKHVNNQLNEIGLKVATIDLLTNPRKAIKQAYLELHRESLPKFMNEQVILDSFEFDFSFIDKNINPKNNEITTAAREFGTDDKGLITPDFSIYATNEEQLNLYNELKAICEALNSFYDGYKTQFTMFLGLVPQALQNYLETDISNLPYLKVNEYRIAQYKLK